MQLFHIITQKDTEVTISLAKDSRTIATASKRDSTSMKILAAVTVIYLPGTFTSSLLATSFFEWSASGSETVLSHRFWIYWAITIPLTAITVAAWLLWTQREERLHKEQELKAQEERRQNMKLDA
jgi:O-antigen/teichoic acid export membrane protein